MRREFRVRMDKKTYNKHSKSYKNEREYHDIIDKGSLSKCMGGITLRYGNGSPSEASKVVGIVYSDYLKLYNEKESEITDENYKKLQTAVNMVFRPERFGMTLDGIDKKTYVLADRAYSREESAFWQATCIDVSNPEYIPTFKDVENHFSVDKDYVTVVRTYKALLASRGIDNIEIPFSARILSVLIERAMDGRKLSEFADAANLPPLTVRNYVNRRCKSARYELLAKIARANGRNPRFFQELLLAAGMKKEGNITSTIGKENGWHQVEEVDVNALCDLVGSKDSDPQSIAGKCGIRESVAKSILSSGKLHVSRPTIKKLSEGLDIPADKLYETAGYRYGQMTTNKKFVAASASSGT